jgi:hypothetical protein
VAVSVAAGDGVSVATGAGVAVGAGAGAGVATGAGAGADAVDVLAGVAFEADFGVAGAPGKLPPGGGLPAPGAAEPESGATGALGAVGVVGAAAAELFIGAEEEVTSVAAELTPAPALTVTVGPATVLAACVVP